ncbi:hypothetical protein [Micromonospora aurantiaca (nom. illeg.)]|uniref:hypothetical protein n=1 Tax=Micromonospora aurantiaca (nom. illeg.) TaxID=47850 RepID=UPI00340BF42D
MLLVACGSGAPDEQPSQRVPSSAAPSVTMLGPSAAAERDALVAYRGMWSAFVEAGKTSDPDAPDLRKYASDDALKLIVSGLVTNRDQGKVILGDLAIDPKVTAVTPVDAPTEASVVDCVNDEKWLVHKASGGLVNDVPGGKHHTTATVKRTADGWKVSRFVIGSESC